MTKNKWLQQLHERNQGMFRVERFYIVDKQWREQKNPTWHEILKYRLIPITPEGVKEAPEDTYVYGPGEGGVPLGLGGKSGAPFETWVINVRRKADSWDRQIWRGSGENLFYIACLSGPNHRETVARFLPDFQWPDESQELPEGIPAPPDGWVYAGTGDVLEYGEECLYLAPFYLEWQGPDPCEKLPSLHYARRATPAECSDESPEFSGGIELTREAQDQGFFGSPGCDELSEYEKGWQDGFNADHKNRIEIHSDRVSITARDGVTVIEWENER